MRMKSINPRSVKHVPQRTCVACGKIRDKQEMVRLVGIAKERVEVDFGGKKAGRGAYLCPTQECWEKGLRSGRLEHFLKMTLPRDNREELTRIKPDFLREQASG